MGIPFFPNKLPDAGEGWRRNGDLIDTEFWFAHKRFMWLDDGDSSTAMWVYLMALNCTLKEG